MAKGNNQKLKLLYLSKILLEETNDSNGLTLAEIAARLKDHDINADRKTLYDDFEELRHFGIDVISEQRGRNHYYHIGERPFELAELKLLVDSIQAAQFMTEKKSLALIRKLEGLTNKYDARELHRQIYFSGSTKAVNESIYYNVDIIHSAINRNVQIRFQYFNWNSRKEMVLRHDGAFYQISPWALVWADEYYYLIGYDAASGGIKHYRVDKMLKLSSTEEKRLGEEAFSALDMASYSQRMFSMFAGKEQRVTLEGDAELVGVIIDHFGTDVRLLPLGKDRFRAYINVAVTDHFIGWIFSLGGRVRVTAPENVTDMIRDRLHSLQDQYS